MEQPYAAVQKSQDVIVREDRRTAEAAVLAQFREARDTEGCSLLKFAQRSGVPESTLRHWMSRARSSGAPKAFVDLVESPEGLLLLHRIVLAAMFVLTHVAGGGIRPLCMFLELSGLWRVVASGYGTQQAAIESMEKAIVAFGKVEPSRLGAEMPAREITVSQDENFHEQPCLVAMEPVSNYILVEEHAEDRRTETWKDAMERGLEGLPVKVIQSTSDEGSSLLSLARESDVHHSPDLFHPQQDISRATSLPLQRQIVAAEKAATEAAQTLEALLDEEEAYRAQRTGPGRPRNYDKRIAIAGEKLEGAEAEVEETKERRQRVRAAARDISKSYHPFDLETGAMRDASAVLTDLEKNVTTIKQAATEAGLSKKCQARLDKAHRVISKLGATIAFVHATAREKVSALNLVPAIEDAVWNLLMPLFYLEQVLPKAPTAEARSALRSTIAALRARLDGPDSPFAGLAAHERELIYQVALWCAQLFQRSSSNVEGRNGVLALLHHSLHHLSPRKLRALTVVHNFVIKRADGTTAAQRFFGQEHRDLFEHLLTVLPPPKRPAARRSAAH